MAAFPRLRTDAVAQYPSSRELATATQVTQFIDGSEQRFRDFRQPARRWVILLHAISDEELAVVEAFFIACQGAAGSFSFTDPWDGVEYPDCSFESQAMESTLDGHGRCTAAVIIRNNQV